MGTDNSVLFSFPNEAIHEVVHEGEVQEIKTPRSRVESKKEFAALNPVNAKNGARKNGCYEKMPSLSSSRNATHIEEAILTLERLARGRGKRRGRPPTWMKEVKRRGRPPGSKNKSKESAVA